MSGADVGKAPTPCPVRSYAMRGTDLGDAGTRRELREAQAEATRRVARDAERKAPGRGRTMGIRCCAAAAAAAAAAAGLCRVVRCSVVGCWDARCGAVRCCVERRCVVIVRCSVMTVRCCVARHAASCRPLPSLHAQPRPPPTTTTRFPLTHVPSFALWISSSRSWGLGVGERVGSDGVRGSGYLERVGVRRGREFGVTSMQGSGPL
eukprot:3919441-Rhodomonas_salina.2